MIGERIKQRRKHLGMSQDELAALLGYDSRATISKIESGIIDMSVSKVEEFAKALKTSSSYLMGWEESATPFPDDQEEIAKVALFGGDGEVTDEMWNEVKGFVEFIKDKRKRENDNN